MKIEKDTSYYKELFRLYQDDRCTPAQMKELFAFINADNSNRLLIEQLHDEFETVFSQDLQQQEAKRNDEAQKEIKVIPLYRKRWINIAAAAVALALVTAVSFYFLNNNRQNKSVIAKNESVPELIEAGGNKAILTLGNGQKIVLDSTVNGTIALQGNATITKNINGQIVYDASGSESNAGEVMYNTVSTPIGGIFKIVLPDGSNVWLNASSSIRFPTVFTGKARSVAITGEAYFEVAKNASMPFKIRINEAEEIEVLGTHFNVMAYDDEPDNKITLLEGSIKISSGGRNVFVKPGQQAVSETPGKIALLNDINTSHVVAWKNGLFDFQNDNLPYIMRQLSRWYNVEIIYSGKVPQGHYVGSIRKQSNIREVLKMLEFAGDVRFSIIGKKIVVNEN